MLLLFKWLKKHPKPPATSGNLTIVKQFSSIFFRISKIDDMIFIRLTAYENKYCIYGVEIKTWPTAWLFFLISNNILIVKCLPTASCILWVLLHLQCSEEQMGHHDRKNDGDVPSNKNPMHRLNNNERISGGNTFN